MNHPRNHFPSQYHHFSLFTLSQMSRSGRLEQPDTPAQTDNNCSLGVIGFSKLADTREAFLICSTQWSRIQGRASNRQHFCSGINSLAKMAFFYFWAKSRIKCEYYSESFIFLYLPINIYYNMLSPLKTLMCYNA